jgi:hypothetical protein
MAWSKSEPETAMRVFAALVLTIVSVAVGAQTTYRWIDKEGKVHYTDRPPAPNEAAKVEQKRAVLLGADQTAAYTLRKAMADYPVTLYTQANCGDPCKNGRDHLARRGAPFSEKSISTQDDVKEVRAIAGQGELVVPLLQVGNKTAKGGYLGSDWDGLLDAAGYPKIGNGGAAAKAASR